MRRLADLAHPPTLGFGAALAFGVIACRPLGDVDIYWQVRLGDVILDAGTPFITEPFLAHRAGVPHDPICWLSQVILALVRRVGDWQAVRVFDALLLVGGFLAVCWPAAVRIKDWPRGWVTLIAGGAGLVCLAPYTTVRPQTFTVFAWGLLLAIFFSHLRPLQKVLSATVVCLFWQNCHPSVGVAAVFLGPAAAAGWVRYWAGTRTTPPRVESVIVLVAAVSQLVTPAGLAIFPIAAANRHMCVDVFRITEWFPITHPINLPSDPGVLRNQPWALHGLGVGLATIGLVVWRRRRVHWEEVMPAAAAFAFCFVAIRFTLLLAPAVVPVWIRCLTPCVVREESDTFSKGMKRWILFLGMMIAAAAVPFVLRPKLDSVYKFPYHGIESLKNRNVTGTVYVYYFWGGIVTDLGYPNWRVSHDGRYYLHTDEAWQAYFHDDMAAFDAFHPAAAVLDSRYDAGLIEKMMRRNDFVVAHADELAVTFVRK